MRGHRWARPERHASIGSTNTELLTDPRPGRVVVADHQSAGQGRRGRTWTAPEGTALAVSVAVRAPDPDVVGWVPLVAGLAVVHALRASRYAVPAGLKWPNDVLARDGQDWLKVAGVLTQAVPGRARGDGVVVIGTGLNIDQDRAQLPVATATSWRLARGGAVLPDGAASAWLQDYLDRLGDLLDTLEGAPEEVAAAYRQECRTLGAQVRVHLPGGQVAAGTAVGIDDRGGLQVRHPDGLRTHLAGDVVHVRPGGSLPA